MRSRTFPSTDIQRKHRITVPASPLSISRVYSSSPPPQHRVTVLPTIPKPAAAGRQTGRTDLLFVSLGHSVCLHLPTSALPVLARNPSTRFYTILRRRARARGPHLRRQVLLTCSPIRPN
ncbi:hypothetical protein LX32DRAFT_140125 [Colletotrichum zoysiae]|uniref:Uncharacterized protein n=1 Tax=Colletotrichum zoysiae TaxID=1216348 RepID=A0AAD9HR31_9PEZI|nr:hypothetical protein LX32DRAFT_140125 [Colletotrichum zoysiae]